MEYTGIFLGGGGLNRSIFMKRDCILSEIVILLLASEVETKFSILFYLIMP